MSTENKEKQLCGCRASDDSLTPPMLIGMNKRYGSKHIGFRLIGF